MKKIHVLNSVIPVVLKRQKTLVRVPLLLPLLSLLHLPSLLLFRLHIDISHAPPAVYPPTTVLVKTGGN